MLTHSAPVSLLSPNSCLSAVVTFVSLGLSYCLVPLLSTPHKGAIWQERVERDVYTLPDTYNVGIRPSKGNTGVPNGFFIVVMDDLNMQILMQHTDTYQWLRSFGTLSFESGSTAAFLFRCDRFVHVTEHQTNEQVAAGPLKGARLVVEEGVVGYGMIYDYDRSNRIRCEGSSEPLNVRDVPSLLDVLRATGHLTLSGYNGGVYQRDDVSGPPLL